MRPPIDPTEMWAKHAPPWWPEGQPWPPHGRRPFRRATRIVFTIAMLAFVAIAVIALTWHAASIAALLHVFLIATLGFLMVGGLLMFVGMKRFGQPLMDLVDAAERVEQGDYTARVAERAWGPPAVRRLISTFNSAITRLEADEDQRRRLLANTSHELRTPLTVMQGELEAMLDGVHPADEEHLSLALDQTHQMARLIEDLRTLALAEAGTLELHREPTDLAALACDVAAAFEAVASRGGVTLEDSNGVAHEGSPEVVLDVDPVRIRQVVDNLVANAIRYAPPDSTVTIEVTRVVRGSRAFAVLRVIDRGPGIPPDLLPLLFNRFRKSDESRGSGLGLAIARELVEAHGGTIRASNTPPTGATFEVTLPFEG